MYEIWLSSQAQRDLRRLPKETSRRVVRVIRKMIISPHPSGCRKIAGSESDWRIRVGDYRIIYEIDDASKTVRVMYIRHRREAYR